MTLTHLEREWLAAGEAALADLRTWHDAAALARHADGGIVGGCNGCGTCRETIPMLEAALKRTRELRDEDVTKWPYVPLTIDSTQTEAA